MHSSSPVLPLGRGDQVGRCCAAPSSIHARRTTHHAVQRRMHAPVLQVHPLAGLHMFQALTAKPQQMRMHIKYANGIHGQHKLLCISREAPGPGLLATKPTCSPTLASALRELRSDQRFCARVEHCCGRPAACAQPELKCHVLQPGAKQVDEESLATQMLTPAVFRSQPQPPSEREHSAAAPVHGMLLLSACRRP